MVGEKGSIRLKEYPRIREYSDYSPVFAFSRLSLPFCAEGQVAYPFSRDSLI
jgi:hypothetical protein